MITVSALSAVAAVIAVMPWVVGFVGAVAAAAIWCSWLDRHPGAVSHTERSHANGRRFVAQPAGRLIPYPTRTGSQPTVH